MSALFWGQVCAKTFIRLTNTYDCDIVPEQPTVLISEGVVMASLMVIGTDIDTLPQAVQVLHPEDDVPHRVRMILSHAFWRYKLIIMSSRL